MDRRRKQTEPSHTEPGQLLKANAVARILDCGVATVYALARQGQIPYVRIGRVGVRFVAADVIASLTQVGPKS